MRPHSLHLYHRQQQPLRQDTHPCEEGPTYCDHVSTGQAPLPPPLNICVSVLYSNQEFSLLSLCLPDWLQTHPGSSLHSHCFSQRSQGLPSLQSKQARHDQRSRHRAQGRDRSCRGGEKSVSGIYCIIIFLIISSWFRSMVLTEPVPLISTTLRMTFISPTHSQTRGLSRKLLRFGERRSWRKLFILRTF